jgi:hypothetical protein
MGKICEKCDCKESDCRCGTDKTEKLTISDGEDEDLEENDESFISLSSFPKTILPEIILGIRHSKFTKKQVEDLFGVRG